MLQRHQNPVGVLGHDFINAISRELSRSGIYLSDTDIQKYVNVLEEHLEGYAYGGERGLVIELENKLIRDKESERTQGLHRSRRQFYVSCHTARHIRSTDLAKALLRFLEDNIDDIDDEEKDFLVTEWCHGLLQLRGLVNDDKWHRALRKLAKRGPPMFERWRRPNRQRSWEGDLRRLSQDRMFDDHGRGRHRLPRYDFPVRRFSVLAQTPNFLDLPQLPRNGYNSPLLRPIHSAVDRLHEQQHIQQHDILMLGRQMHNLFHPY